MEKRGSPTKDIGKATRAVRSGQNEYVRLQLYPAKNEGRELYKRFASSFRLAIQEHGRICGDTHGQELGAGPSGRDEGGHLLAGRLGKPNESRRE